MDIGHLDIEYEWYIKRTSDKIKIEGKYVNEVAGGRVVGECKDERYLSSIIKEF